ncbi:hypothetical protein ACFW1M_29055 [Streptomyces inhibens]|uniref:hypothetical protein n=1 Tax=Streptomyces inhibens TaxID=2293571 RepID=UPI0036B6A441
MKNFAPAPGEGTQRDVMPFQRIRTPAGAMGMKGINGGGEWQNTANNGDDVGFLTIEAMEALQTPLESLRRSRSFSGVLSHRGLSLSKEGPSLSISGGT